MIYNANLERYRLIQVVWEKFHCSEFLTEIHLNINILLVMCLI